MGERVNNGLNEKKWAKNCKKKNLKKIKKKLNIEGKSSRKSRIHVSSSF